MKLIMIPNDLDKDEFALVSNKIAEIKKNPATEDDYCLVDKISGEINIKVFVGSLVDEICVENQCTPRQFLMEMMTQQNEGK